MAELRQRRVEVRGRVRRQAPCEAAHTEVSALVRTIEGEIIPRLIEAHAASPAARVPKRRAPNGDDVAEITRLILGADAGAALSFVHALRDEGVAVEAIYLGLLAPAARRLGDLWFEDRCDFTEVTVGLWRLQQVLRALSPTFQNEGEARGSAKLRAILSPLPGEQHVFGVLMVAEFFRRDGWDVWDEPCTSLEELLGVVRGNWFDVAGLSLSSAISSENRLESTAHAVRAIRHKSTNRAIRVMVGGRIFLEHPEYAAQVGADGTAADERLALSAARHLIDPDARPG